MASTCSFNDCSNRHTRVKSTRGGLRPQYSCQSTLSQINLGTTGEAIVDSLILENQTIATVLQTVSPLTLRRPSHFDSRLRSQLAELVKECAPPSFNTTGGSRKWLLLVVPSGRSPLSGPGLCISRPFGSVALSYKRKRALPRVTRDKRGGTLSE